MLLINNLKNKVKAEHKGLLVLLYTEIQELFGRFGITALLVLYLTKQLNFSDAHAFTIYSLFIAAIFVTPVIGGYIADRYFGFKNAIIIGGMIMTIGNLFLIYPASDFIMTGLTIVAIGSGLFTPSLAALLGRLYEDKEHKRERGFTLYYICKNVGALLAPILCGLVAHYYNYNYAFLLSAISMASGVIIFSYGKKHLPGNHQKNATKLERTASNKPIVSRVKKQLAFVLLLTLFVVIFSTCLGQGGTTLNLFIDRIIDRQFFSIIIPTSFFYTLDPLFMILIGPILTVFFVFMVRKNKAISTVGKFALAMFILAGGFLIFSAASIIASKTGHASMLFIVGAYFLFPIAELCIMPVALAAVTRYAPKNLQAMMVGIFMLGQASAGYLTGVISKVGNINFPVTNLLGLQHAAKIYLHLFVLTASILCVTGILLIILKPLLYKLVGKEDDLPAAFEETTPVTTALEI